VLGAAAVEAALVVFLGPWLGAIIAFHLQLCLLQERFFHSFVRRRR
tara:strand:- start:168 stop:305 length:138 start_codon:yes stop_codon:yes gene_type:complete